MSTYDLDHKYVAVCALPYLSARACTKLRPVWKGELYRFLIIPVQTGFTVFYCNIFPLQIIYLCQQAIHS